MDATPLPLMFVGDDRRVLLVGGGAIALEKLERLLDVGVRPDVIAARVAPEVAALAAAHRLVVREREFAHGDTEGYPLVLVAVGGARDVARAIHAEVTARGGLINCADDPILCNVFLSANLRHAGVTVAVSSHGTSSAMAARLRDRLRATLPAWLDAALPRLAALRARLQRLPGDAAARRVFLQRVVRGPWARALGTGEVTVDALAARYAAGEALAGEVVRVAVAGADPDALPLGALDALARADRVVCVAGVADAPLAAVRPGAAVERDVPADAATARADARAAAGEVVVVVAPA